MHKKIFTEEQDLILRKYYPDNGAPYCLELIGQQTGIWFTYQQIRSRIRRLGLGLSEGTAIYGKQNEPRPLWVEIPEDFVGPCYFRCGVFLIINYCGSIMQGRKVKKRIHMHLSKCLVCGDVSIRKQNSTVRAARLDSKGCRRCAERRNIEREAAVNHFLDRDIWHAEMMRIPATPLEFIPETCRFDSQRHSR